MALMKGKHAEIPGDAVVLSRNEALNYQVKILNTWKYPLDVFAYKYGSFILASASAFVGIFINNYYRRKFKLHSYGKISSYLPIAVVPAVMSFFTHYEFVLPDLVLQDNCPVCVQMRSTALQASIGFILPAVLGPLATLPLATQHGKINVPYITREPLKVLQLVKTTTKPVANLLFAIFIGQALLGSMVAYFESRSVIKVNQKLAKLEYELEHKANLHM